MVVRDVVICGSCGAPAGHTEVFCTYCKSMFVSESILPDTKETDSGEDVPVYRDTFDDHEPDRVDVEYLKDGQFGYMVPWGMGRNGVHGKYSVMLVNEPHGTHEVRVKKKRGTLYINFFDYLWTEHTNWPKDISIPFKFYYF